jgi:hypothetical protein
MSPVLALTPPAYVDPAIIRGFDRPHAVKSPNLPFTVTADPRYEQVATFTCPHCQQVTHVLAKDL